MVAKRIAWLVLLAGCLTAAGCWFRGPGDVRREVVRVSDLELNREFGLQLGRPTLFLVRQGLRIAGEEDEIPLHGVRRVELGVYTVENGEDRQAPDRLRPVALRGGPGAGRSPGLCRARFERWEPVVRVCDADEHVLLFVRLDEAESIRGVLVVIQDPEEVVIVRARGRLEPVLERLLELAGEHDAFHGLDVRRARGGDAEPAPLIAACEADGVHGDGGSGCADREEVRERTLDVARALTLDHDALAQRRRPGGQG